MHTRGERATVARLFLSPIARFLRFYVMRLGFLDGVAGFAHIAIGCFGSFLKYAKLRALTAAEPCDERRRAAPRCSPSGEAARSDASRSYKRRPAVAGYAQEDIPMTGAAIGRVLVTGCAGFIGMHTAARLLDAGTAVIGVDNLDAYYDVTLKEARLARLTGRAGFRFERIDLAEADAAARLFHDHAFTHVVHLAAQPGVRYSLINPGAYFANNSRPSAT